MKALKIIWYVLAATLFAVGLTTGRREFFALSVMMAAVLLYSFALNVWTILSFHYTQDATKRVSVKGADATLLLRLYNENPFPFALIQADVALAAYNQTARYRFSLPPGGVAAFDVPVPCPYRGVFDVGLTTLTVHDSFGLVRTRFDMRRLPYYRPLSLKVYPRLTELPALPASEADAKRHGARRAAYDGETYGSPRPFAPGDPLKRVHKALSARQRALFVREAAPPIEEAAVCITIDTATGQTGEEHLRLADLLCECALAAAFYNLRAGRGVILRGGGATERVESLRGLPRLNDWLAELRFTAQGEPPESVQTEAAAYVISARRVQAARARVIHARLGDDAATLLTEEGGLW